MRHTNNLRLATALVPLILMTACGDARLDKLSLGISRDSTQALMGAAPHRTASYLTASKQWEVQFYAQTPAGDKDSLPWRKMSPVVFIDGKSVGWGWSWWEDEAAKQKITMPAK